MKYYLKKEKDIPLAKINYFKPVYDIELDDISSISSDIYNVFSESGIGFYLSLNKVNLPINTIAGLGYFIDGFKEYLQFLYNDGIADYMYWIPDQGTETNIYFYKKIGQVEISEFEYLKGKFTMDIDDLKIDAVNFLDELNSYVEEFAPNISLHPWFLEWKSELRGIIQFS